MTALSTYRLRYLYIAIRCVTSHYTTLRCIALPAVVEAGGEGLLSRKSSGSVYDNFACVRVGDYDLPSSMDLRQYLDEMQEVGQWEDDNDLPTIPDDEVHPPSAWIPLLDILIIEGTCLIPNTNPKSTNHSCQ